MVGSVQHGGLYALRLIGDEFHLTGTSDCSVLQDASLLRPGLAVNELAEAGKMHLLTGGAIRIENHFAEAMSYQRDVTATMFTDGAN